MNATRAAVEEGVVPGGGVALLYATKILDNVKLTNADQQVGVNIVKKAIERPVRQIVKNAGIDGSIIVGKLLEQDNQNYGYNAQTSKFTDLVQDGIIDPTKVVISAIQDSASVAGLLVTAEAVIADLPEEKKDTPPMPDMGGGGMGGMGGGMPGMDM